MQVSLGNKKSFGKQAKASCFEIIYTRNKVLTLVKINAVNTNLHSSEMGEVHLQIVNRHGCKFTNIKGHY